MTNEHADTAKQIRQDPAFKNLIRGLSDAPKIRASQLADLAANGGAKLGQSMNRDPQPEQQAEL